MNSKELLAWWKEVPSKQKTYARLSPTGAVASELSFRRGDIEATVESFQRDRVRLSARYPEFWRGVQACLAGLIAELEAEAVAEVVRELELDTIGEGVR